MRVLALDHGLARIGCATCDPTGTLVRPLAAIEPATVEGAAEEVERIGAERVVVGLPRPLGGGSSEQTEITLRFRAELAEAVPVPVDTHDERLTTRMAQQTRRAGATADEDSLAAAHLLESYLATLDSEADGLRRERDRGDEEARE